MAGSRPTRRRRAPETDLGFTWGMGNTVLLVVGLVVLAAGYIALSRGSISLAPALLVAGYCLFIPASLLLRGRRNNAGE